MFFRNKKTQDDDLINEIESLKKEIKSCRKDINQYKKDMKKFKSQQKEYDARINSNHELISTLLLDYDLKPKGILKNMQTLSQELLDFAVNICNKHDLNYWITAGTFLGAYRHGGFVPWDDDIDMGLMRKDYVKFCNITFDEIKNNNACDFITFKVHPMIRKDFVSPYTKLECRTDNDDLLATTDIIPYEWANDNEFNLKEFRDFRDEFFIRLSGGEDIKYILKDLYERFNLDYDNGNYIIQNPTFRRHSKHLNKEVACFDKDRFFPLEPIEFNGKTYNGPKDPVHYLLPNYNDYMEIPKNLGSLHHCVDNIRHLENLDEIYSDLIDKVRNCNENFK